MPINARQLNSLIKGREWYHQRFDGSPMFLFAVGEAEIKKEPRKPARTEADVRVCFFSRGKADWYLDMTDVKRGSKAMIDLAKKNPNISAKLLKAWREDEQAFEDFFWREFPKIKLAKLSDKELLELWQRYYNLFIKRFTSSSVIDHFALGTDEIISQSLRHEVSQQNKNLTSSELGEIFSLATAPVKQSFINQAEIDLLKIVTGRSKEALADYQQRYFWTKNNYVVAQVLTAGHFREDIKAWKQSGKDLRQELSKIENTPRRNSERKARLFKKYRLSRLLRSLIKISDDFSWWQDERKKSTYLNIHMGSKILSEIAKRRHYELDELKYAVAPEVADIIKNGAPNRRALQARRANSVFIVTREGYTAKTGKEAEAIRKIMLGSHKLSDIKDIRGLTASMGRAIGTVKVLKSATEINKVKPGDILVAVMTRPDYVPAMKRAAAIVTNEGGITSHAAIVSRELGIPCLIGTKIATEVFKDGDKVEVNANHGWVRKVS